MKKKADNQIESTIETSENIKKIIQENKIYSTQNAELAKRLSILEKKNKNILKVGMIKWFLSGGGVLLLGWIIGQSVSSHKRKTKSSLLG